MSKARRQLDLTNVPEWRKPAISVPLSQAFPQFDEIKEFRSKICLFNHDRTKLFDVVSPKYQLVQHSTALDRISSAMEEYFGKVIEPQVRTYNQGASLSAIYKMPVAPIKLADGKDVNEITLLVRNSYDRSHVFSADLGAYRLICANGAKVGQSFGSLKARHVGLNDDDMILDGLTTMIENAPKLRDLWGSWMDTMVTQDEAFQLLDGTFPDKYLAPVLAKPFPRTKWELYNDLTRFSTHDTTSLRRRMEFDDTIANLFYAEAEEA